MEDGFLHTTFTHTHTHDPRPTTFSYTRTNVREFVSGPILAVAVRDAKIGPDLRLEIYRGYYTVARRYELYFRVAKQYFTNERSEWVKYCFCNEKIKFISSSRRVMFFLLYRQKDIDKIIDFYSPKSNCDGSHLQYSNTRHWLQWSWEITLNWI